MVRTIRAKLQIYVKNFLAYESGLGFADPGSRTPYFRVNLVGKSMMGDLE